MLDKRGDGAIERERVRFCESEFKKAKKPFAGEKSRVGAKHGRIDRGLSYSRLFD